MISIEFSLFSYTKKIGEKEYEFKTKGGRIMALGLIGGFIAKHFGYISWPALGIVGASIGACLAWDVLTALLFKWRMARKIKWVGELIDAIPGDVELWLGEVETEDGSRALTFKHCLAAFDSLETAKRITGESLDGNHIDFYKAPVAKLYDFLANERDLCGVYFYHGDKASVIATDDLPCFMGIEPDVNDKIKEILESTDQKYMVGFVKETSFVPLYLTEDGKEYVCLFANDDAVVAFREAFPTMKTGISSFDDLDLVPVDLAKSYEILKEIGSDTFALIYGDRCRYLPVEVLKQYL